VIIRSDFQLYVNGSLSGLVNWFSREDVEMSRDPKRSIHSYQLQGGNLNEFEFQKSQGEMEEESKPSSPVETDNPNLSQPKRVAVTAEAHKKVEKRR
jgi:hypothetical protein